MKLKACAVFLLASMALAAQAKTFDGKRKGVIIGGGVGGANLIYDEGGSFELNEFSLAINFKGGHAPSESFEIYLLNSASVSQDVGLFDFLVIGVTKYLNRAGKGLFLFGGVGLAFRYLLFADLQVGAGVLAGVGCDIARHWSIQGDILYTNLEPGMFSKKSSIVSYRLTLNFLAF